MYASATILKKYSRLDHIEISKTRGQFEAADMDLCCLEIQIFSFLVFQVLTHDDLKLTCNKTLR